MTANRPIGAMGLAWLGCLCCLCNKLARHWFNHHTRTGVLFVACYLLPCLAAKTALLIA